MLVVRLDLCLIVLLHRMYRLVMTLIAALNIRVVMLLLRLLLFLTANCLSFCYSHYLDYCGVPSSHDCRYSHAICVAIGGISRMFILAIMNVIVMNMFFFPSSFALLFLLLLLLCFVPVFF